MNTLLRNFAVKVVFLAVPLANFVSQNCGAGNFYAGVSPTNVFWPGGVIPYEFATNITAAEQQTYLNGVREWELAANIHFVARTTQTNWILFQYAPGTFLDQFVPYTTPETVTVSVLSRAQVCHEMGHALGFTHENIRTDKTAYITVLTNNVYPASNIYWFTIDPASVKYGPYDFESVMHLANNFSSISTNLYTQVANPPYQSFQPFMGNLALSEGDRQAAAYLYGPPATGVTNIVTNTADAGVGSLRAALYYGMDHPGATIRFNIPTNDPGYSNGVFTIHLTGYLPPLVADGTIIDGSTQPGFAGRPLIIIDGSQMIPEAYSPGTVTGLLIYAANCQVRNLSFQNFNWNGLTISYPGATGNTIAGCWCGLDHTGTNSAPNAYQGILIYNGACSNTVGGASAPSRNVLSGNTEYGVYITGPNTIGNVVGGNYIGTDPAGALAVANGYGGSIITGGAWSNTLGGSLAGQGNLVSGNVNFGLWLDSSNDTVAGNWFGLSASGAGAVPNTFVGMYLINGGQNNLISGNVFSGNDSEGIRVTGPGTSGNLITGNFMGTDPTGSYAIPNGFAGLTFFDGATGNIAGGASASARNVISGNDSYGVAMGDPGTSGNIVEGNYIGLGSNGTTVIGNYGGVLLYNQSTDNVIGAGNVISGNSAGVWLTNTAGNVIEGNIIGLAADGVTPRGNAWQGVLIQSDVSNNVIGLSPGGAGAGNRIACNGEEGIIIYSNASVGNTIRGNDIYSNGDLGINLAGGVENSYGVTANHAGGAVPGPNDLQNYPVISNAFQGGASMILAGSLNSAAHHTFIIDAYRNAAPDPSGYGEGQFYLGSTTVTTDSNGNTAFYLEAPGAFAGQYLTTTATDQATGDSSEFSLDVVATNGLAPASFAAPLGYSAVAGFSGHITLVNGQSYHIQESTNLGAHPVAWANLTNFIATTTNYDFQDRSATNGRARYYRVISP